MSKIQTVYSQLSSISIILAILFQMASASCNSDSETNVISGQELENGITKQVSFEDSNKTGTKRHRTATNVKGPNIENMVQAFPIILPEFAFVENENEVSPFKKSTSFPDLNSIVNERYRGHVTIPIFNFMINFPKVSMIHYLEFFNMLNRIKEQYDAEKPVFRRMEFSKPDSSGSVKNNDATRLRRHATPSEYSEESIFINEDESSNRVTETSDSNKQIEKLREGQVESHLQEKNRYHRGSELSKGNKSDLLNGSTSARNITTEANLPSSGNLSAGSRPLSNQVVSESSSNIDSPFAQSSTSSVMEAKEDNLKHIMPKMEVGRTPTHYAFVQRFFPFPIDERNSGSIDSQTKSSSSANTESFQSDTEGASSGIKTGKGIDTMGRKDTRTNSRETSSKSDERDTKTPNYLELLQNILNLNKTDKRTDPSEDPKFTPVLPNSKNISKNKVPEKIEDFTSDYGDPAYEATSFSDIDLDSTGFYDDYLDYSPDEFEVTSTRKIGPKKETKNNKKIVNQSTEVSTDDYSDYTDSDLTLSDSTTIMDIVGIPTAHKVETTTSRNEGKLSTEDANPPKMKIGNTVEVVKQKKVIILKSSVSDITEDGIISKSEKNQRVLTILTWVVLVIVVIAFISLSCQMYFVCWKCVNERDSMNQISIHQVISPHKDEIGPRKASFFNNKAGEFEVVVERFKKDDGGVLSKKSLSEKYSTSEHLEKLKKLAR